MQPLIATKSLPYGGVRHEAGARFMAKPRDARLLVAMGRASLAPEDEVAAEQPAKAEPKAAKGTYNRRDLKAKE